LENQNTSKIKIGDTALATAAASGLENQTNTLDEEKKIYCAVRRLYKNIRI